MKNFVAVSFCVLAALASSANGDAIRHLLGVDGFDRANAGSQPAISEDDPDTSKRCCYIADIEMFLPILFNGTEIMKREATDLISHITMGCKAEPDVVRNVKWTYDELLKKFNLEDTKDLLEDDRILKGKFNIFSCNVGDYLSLLPMLANGTDDEKVAVFDVLMISIERCNLIYRPGDKAYRHCDLDNKQKWRLFLQWMVNRFRGRMVFGKKRISAEQLLF